MNITEGLLGQVREKTPLVHFITNLVTMNDCANITLACGGSPIMTDEIAEVDEITSLCSALVLNIGTVNERTLAAMLQAGRHANNLGIPVVLDPVGAGASKFRNNAVNLLLKEVNFTAIKGNISEIKFLSYGITSTQGVDAAAEDLVKEENLLDSLRFAQKLSIMTGSVIAITGPIDIVADNHSGYIIRNGSPMMPLVTGTGCMSAAVAGCFLGAGAAAPLVDPLASMVASIACIGICGELAQEQILRQELGTAALRGLIIDMMSRLTDPLVAERIKLQQAL